MATHKSKYMQKQKSGCQVNHARHSKAGIPWCSLCQKENRPNAPFVPEHVIKRMHKEEAESNES